MKPTALVAVFVLSAVLTGCGDGNDGESDSEDEGASETVETVPPDQAAVVDALVASFFDPSCDLLTEDYLLEKALLSDTAEEACDEHMRSWVEPQYDADDVLVTDVEIVGDVATAEVGSEFVNITTTYELTRVDGDWLVSCDEYVCDDVEPDSAEVS